MSSEDPSAPIGHNDPPIDGEGVDPLVEAVAQDLWASRDELPWEDAGTFWRWRFRELATAAIKSVRRHDR